MRVPILSVLTWQRLWGTGQWRHGWQCSLRWTASVHLSSASGLLPGKSHCILPLGRRRPLGKPLPLAPWGLFSPPPAHQGQAKAKEKLMKGSFGDMHTKRLTLHFTYAIFKYNPKESLSFKKKIIFDRLLSNQKSGTRCPSYLPEQKHHYLHPGQRKPRWGITRQRADFPKYLAFLI